MVNVLPLYRSSFWDQTEPFRDREVSAWVEEAKRRPNITDGFRETGARFWVRQLIEHWKLTDYKVTDIAAMTGTTDGTASRFLNHYTTSLGTIALLAARFGKPVPPPKEDRFAFAGIGFVLPLCEWLDVTRKTRPRRTAIEKALSVSSSCLLFALFHSSLEEQWHQLTVRYEDDLIQAADDPRLRELLSQLSDSYLSLTSSLPDARYQRAIYFPNGGMTSDSRWLMCRDLNELWSRHHFFWPCMWEVISGLHPMLTASESQDEDDVA